MNSGILVLIAMTLAMIAAFIYFGLKASAKIKAHAEEADSEFADIFGTQKLTVSGSILFGLLIGFWLALVVARGNFPDTSLGSFVSSSEGFIAAVMASIFVFVGVAELLRAIGYPLLTPTFLDTK